MASLLPAVQQRSTSEAPVPRQLHRTIALALASGMKRTEIAQKLAKGNPRKAKVWRRRLVVMAKDPAFQMAIAEQTQAIMLYGLPEASEALARRAARGRPDAIKLLFEATGFHNPKVQHEHTGGIELKVTMAPRPKRVETVDSTAVEDAEVVE